MGRREEPIPALSSGLSHVVLTGLLLAVAFPAAQPLRPMQPGPAPQPEAPRHAPAQPVTPAVVAPPPTAAAPTPAPSGTPSVTPEPLPDVWPQSEVMLAREQCMHLLSGVPAEFDYLEPIKNGQCGLPAPVRLKSVGSGSGSGRVTFDPPVQVNCRMVAALAGWVKSTLQPEARARLKSDVVQIIGASGYACRNIYHRTNARLSQHALANAVDISAFGLANGRTIRVLRGWGLTVRDLRARAEARAKLAAKAKAEAKGGAKTKGQASKTEVADSKAGKSEGPGGRVDKPARLMTKASLALPSQKTAPADALPAEEADPAKPSKEALFLRAIHEGACSDFGTVLGPEANDPHRNHFHLDLIPRRGRGYCR